jgi:hypothetical protein
MKQDAPKNSNHPDQSNSRKPPEALATALQAAGGSGLSKEDPVVILSDTTKNCVEAEYEWLGQHFGNWTLVKQALQTLGDSYFDEIEIKTSEGATKSITFESRPFLGSTSAPSQ